MKRKPHQTLEEYIQEIWEIEKGNGYSYKYMKQLEEKYDLSYLGYSSLREKFITNGVPNQSTSSTWDIDKVEEDLDKAFRNNSEVELLQILKNNSFLFHPLYSRKFGIQPNFSEVSFAGEMRCDFAWLNDNSDGPEWVLVEIERPKMKLFKKDGDPTVELNHAVEQVKSWDRYFKENLGERKRIFGAVSRFRLILVAGTREDWQTEKAIKWRAYHNEENKIEIRSTDIFKDALKYAKNHFSDLWSFEENPVSLKHTELKKFWKEYNYMDLWRKIF